MLVTKDDLDYGSKVPLYRQLADALSKAIEVGLADGTLQPGDPLPTEMELCEALDLSRSTVRKAYNELIEWKSVTRRAGQGTFVKRRRIHRSFEGAPSFHSEMRALGYEPSSKILSITKVRPTTFQMAGLGLSIPEPVWDIVRADYADGIPLCVANVAVPVELMPELDSETAGRSFYEMFSEAMEDAGTSLERIHEAYGVASLPEWVAEVLGIDAGAPCFRIQRTTYDAEGRAWESAVRYETGENTRFDIDIRPDEVSYSHRY